MLEKTYPGNSEEFWADGFVARKTKRSFSTTALCQAQEQYVMQRGGAVGLTDNPSALRRWMVTGPEIARM
jgi:hypothetical protein